MNTDPSPIAPQQAQSAKSFFHYAATASVWLSLVPWVLGFLTEGIYERMDGTPIDVVIRLLAVVFMLGCPFLGLVFGVIALGGITKYGRKGILVKSLAGIVITICWILVCVFTIST